MDSTERSHYGRIHQNRHYDPGHHDPHHDHHDQPSAISFLWIHTILHDILGFDTIITRYQRYFMTPDRCKICQKNSAKCVICMSDTHNGTR